MRQGPAYLLFASLALAGCGGIQGGIAANSWGSSEHLSPGSRASSDLLYIAHTVGVRSRFHGVLDVLTFPGGKPYASTDLEGGLATGACSDSSGNVWVVVKDNYESHAYEYAHGGTAPIATIHIAGGGGSAGDCAVDPSTGNLAVLVGAPSAGYAEIWAHAREGKPARYQLAFTPTSCAYDGNGNLFVDGWLGDTVLFELAELSEGSRAFANVTLDKPPSNYPGNVRWDGSDIDIADNAFSGGYKIYRVKVSGYTGHVDQIVRLEHLSYLAVFDVHSNRLAGNAGSNGRFLSLWPFPAGGKRTRTLAKLEYAARGVAISVAPQ